MVEAEENQFDRVLKEGSSRLESEIALEVGRTVERFISIHFQGIDSNAINRGFLQLLKSGIANAERPEAIRWGVRFLQEYESRDGGVILNGETAFHLYETYGLPMDFMIDAAHDFEIGFDQASFEVARAEEQARARASWKGGSQKSASPAYRELPKTDFLGESSSRQPARTFWQL